MLRILGEQSGHLGGRAAAVWMRVSFLSPVVGEWGCADHARRRSEHRSIEDRDGALCRDSGWTSKCGYSIVQCWIDELVVMKLRAMRAGQIPRFQISGQQAGRAANHPQATPCSSLVRYACHALRWGFTFTRVYSGITTLPTCFPLSMYSIASATCSTPLNPWLRSTQAFSWPDANRSNTRFLQRRMARGSYRVIGDGSGVVFCFRALFPC